MLLDDTKHTTYIHDLDQELAEQEPPSEHLVILPLADKLISSVPESLVSASKGKEVVLYSQPASDTTSDEENVVKRMIAEWKARAKTRMMENHNHHTSNDITPSLHGSDTFSTTSEAFHVEPMDIDCDF